MLSEQKFYGGSERLTVTEQVPIPSALTLRVGRARYYRCTPSGPGTPTIRLDDARRLPLFEGGVVFIVENLSTSRTLAIANFGEDKLQVVQPSTVCFIHLIDRSTANGEWEFLCTSRATTTYTTTTTAPTTTTTTTTTTSEPTTTPSSSGPPI